MLPISDPFHWCYPHDCDPTQCGGPHWTHACTYGTGKPVVLHVSLGCMLCASHYHPEEEGW